MNEKLTQIFNEIAELLDMKEAPFKPRAFEKAAYAISALAEDVKDIYKKLGLKGLEEIPGVGRGIAERIEEFIKTGQVEDYQRLKSEVPVDLKELSKIEGLGPKTILRLYKKLGIKTVSQLEKAIQSHKLCDLEGLGEKTEQKLLQSISFLKQSHGRFNLGDILPKARFIVERVKQVPGVQKAEFAGSIRRMQETIGDLDILVISNKPRKVMDFFVSMPEVKAIYSKGDTKSSVRLDMGMDADVRVLPPESFGAALQYFTGDKYHNIKLREIAMSKGYKLNEYGLFKAISHELKTKSSKIVSEKLIAGQTEEEIYEALGMEWMPPEIRTNHGEIEAALEHKLPDLISYGSVRGDLQTQTNWTDGENSIKEMAETAKKIGLEYICITDHTQSLAITGGSDEKKLLRQMIEIDKIQEQVFGIKLLKGVEVNILKNGTLDIEDEVLAKLDVVGASVHSHFNLPEKEQTARVIRAMENPNVDILFHPTGRKIGLREPIKLDIDEILKAAKRTKTILEINAGPDRLDLKDQYIRKAVDMGGIKFAIDSDAHNILQYQWLEYGLAQARRGWATKNHVINTRSWQGVLKILK